MTETVLAHCMTTASMWFLGAVLHAMYANVTTPATVACTALASTLLHSIGTLSSTVQQQYQHVIMVASRGHSRQHIVHAASSMYTHAARTRAAYSIRRTRLKYSSVRVRTV